MELFPIAHESQLLLGISFCPHDFWPMPDPLCVPLFEDVFFDRGVSMLTGRGHCMHVGVVTYEGVHALHTRASVAYGVGRVMRAVRAQAS